MRKKTIFLFSILIGLLAINLAFADTSIQWGNLQWPFATQVLVNAETENIYGQVSLPGVTDSPGQGAGITAEVGYGPVDSDPTTWTNWTEATFNVDAGSNDEYMGNLVVSTAGTYHYTYRYIYEGDMDYYFAAERGTLTVNDQPPPQVDITFQVDMNYVDEISPNGVHIAGSFQGWDPGSTEMLDNDGDGIYSVTIELTGGDYHEYKYINGNSWGQDEANNRSLTTPEEDTVLNPVYFDNIGPELADVTFTVIDSTFSYVNIQIKGTMNDWTAEPMYDDGTNGDETANDHIWTAIIYGVNQGDHQWGAIEDDGSEFGIWLIDGPNLEFSVDEEGNVTGQTSYVVPDVPAVANVTFTIIDSTSSYVNIHIKGTFNDWSAEPMYDDGTNGDEVAQDHIWTVIKEVQEGNHEWGAIEDDGTEDGIWLIEDGNLTFSVDDEGAVTGQTSYGIPPLPAVADVQLRVIDNTNSYENIKIKGTFNDWIPEPMYDDGTNGDEIAGDHIWTINKEILEGDHEWGALEDDGSEEGIWLIEGVNPEFTVHHDGSVTGQTSYLIPYEATVADIIFTVVDGTESYQAIQIKGSFNDWIPEPMYDDGTHGDEVAGDHLWTATVEVQEGNHEWGAIEDDGSEFGIWLIQGPNPQFTLHSDGSVIGQTSYTIPTPNPLVNVTFRVDMGLEVVPESIFVIGSFLNWIPEEMFDDDNDDIYELTLEIQSEEEHYYKFMNGSIYEIIPSDCGVDDGFGGYNRYVTVEENDMLLNSMIFGTCDTSGTFIEDINAFHTPQKFNLMRNYPNPFNPATTIQFEIPVASQRAVKLQIYDISGKLIKTLLDEPMETGYHSVVWDGKDDAGQDVPSGVYFYKIETDSYTKTKSMLLLK